MSEEIKFKGLEYLQAFSFTQHFGKELEGYTKDSNTIPKLYKTVIQQNNTILALFSSLHYKLSILEKLITEVPKLAQNIEQELVDITSNLKNIFISKTELTRKV